jgi:hypothetical protein
MMLSQPEPLWRMPPLLAQASAAMLHLLDPNLPGSWLMTSKAPDQASRKVLAPMHLSRNGGMRR